MPHALVIVPVPEVEPYVASLRERFDRSARRGLGAHVTLLHTPMPPDGIDAAMITSVAGAISGVAPFRYAVTGLAHFAGTIYLAVDPWTPFNELHARLVSRLARPHPGAAGRKPEREFVPHISVVRIARRSERAPGQPGSAIDALPVAEVELIPLLDATPLRCECRDIVLLEDSTGVWQPVRTFALSGCTDSPSPAPS